MRRHRSCSEGLGPGRNRQSGNLAARLPVFRRALPFPSKPMNDETRPPQTNNDPDHQLPSWREVFLYFLVLGFVNVGGPVAQITMMFNHMVEKRRWLTRDRFVKIMAFCHMLPGPEALQLAIYVGYLRRRFLGGILAGLTFIIPGAAADDSSELALR